MAFCNRKETEKAKLQRELEYYTSLVSNHEKLQQGSKTISKDTKSKRFVKPFLSSVQTGQCSNSIRNAEINNVITRRSVISKANTFKRSVIHNPSISSNSKSMSSFSNRSVVVPKSPEIKRNHFCDAPFKNIQQRSVLYNPKNFTTKETMTITSRSGLPPQVSLRSTKELSSSSRISSSTKANDLGKILSETEKVFLKAGSTKQIEELKLLTKQLEQKKKKISLAKSRISALPSSNSCDALTKEFITLCTNKSLLEKPTEKSKTELEVLKIKLENHVKKCTISKSMSDNVPKISGISNMLPSSTDKSPLSPMLVSNSRTPSILSITANLKNDPFASNQVLEKNTNLSKIEKNSELAKSSIASININTLHQPNNVLKPLATGDQEMSVVDSLMKAHLLENKLPLKAGKLTSPKLANSQKCQLSKVSTPLVKRINPQRLSSTKKRGSMTKLVSSKYKIVNKRVSPKVETKNLFYEAFVPCLVNSGKNLIKKSGLSTNQICDTSKDVKTEVGRCQKNVLSNYASTPLAKSGKSLKVNSVRKRVNMTKLIASKYKVVNKKTSNSPVVSGNPNNNIIITKSLNKFATPTTCKTPSVIKKRNSKYKVVNLVKTTKRLSGSLLKSPSPKYLKKGKYVLKRKLNTPISTNAQAFKYVREQGKHVLKSFPISPVLPKPQFKHTKVNYLIANNLKKYSKPDSSMKLTPTLKSKYKVINRRGSSKKSPKSLSQKSNAVRRTKSGVDIDLLLELAAEKEESEKTPVKKIMKKAVLSKRVYKSKNAIINKNVSTDTGAKMARMIKAKYLFNRNPWQKPSSSKKFHVAKYFKGFQKTTTSQFLNHRIKSNYFRYPIPNNRHKLLSSYTTSPGYNRTNKRNFTYKKDHLKTFPNQAISTPISKVLASRVLHQSINRVITATAKKKLSKVNTYCMFYNRFGRCNKGLKCTYVHDPSKIAVCTRFLRGTCKNKKCLFSHEISPGKMAICSFFLLGSCTKIDCPYRHETLSPNAELCKAFVQGYCPDGKQCKKAHVLVCPHFIQGFCEKGDACAFPHPPSKERKMLSKPNEKIETPMEVEDLMEKVSRYFQPLSERSMVSGTDENVVVPRRQKLPEQPSFIAL